ncbi:MAG: hypothetical protein ACFE9Z_09860 [Promethearchaeota archaeon]
MDSQEFINQLRVIERLMEQEQYKKAIDLIENLKKVDKESNFNYNLTHRLYQLDSNSHSLFNQQVILANVRDLSKNYKSITFQELNHVLKSKNDLNLTNDILRREIELLILRNQLQGKIEEDRIILS